MLIRFTVENWMSFRDPVTFSMIATRELQHKDRLTRLERYKTRILPIAAIYGGNASGKTNLFKAISFAKRMVVQGIKPDLPIPVEPFMLDNTGIDNPISFKFEILIDEIIYEFSFTVTKNNIIEEKLVELSRNSEKVLYKRYNNSVECDKSVLEQKLFQFAFTGTSDNQLLITNPVLQKIDKLSDVLNWFKDSLVLIAPDSRFEPFELLLNDIDPRNSLVNDMLLQLDTGIINLDWVDIPFKTIQIPETLKDKIQEDIKDGFTAHVSNQILNERFLITRRNEKLIAKKLVTQHPTVNGEKVKFEIQQESDGSKRIIDLLPIFLDLLDSSSKKIYIIDEIDRSLHTLLIRRLLELFLAGCNDRRRTQLLLTTHDVLLMDQELFRRDEMWITERGSTGASTLISFCEYKDIRIDKDIRKSYLQGRFGGIPRLLYNEALAGSSHNST